MFTPARSMILRTVAPSNPFSAKISPAASSRRWRGSWSGMGGPSKRAHETVVFYICIKQLFEMQVLSHEPGRVSGRGSGEGGGRFGEELFALEIIGGIFIIRGEGRVSRRSPLRV